MGLEVLSSCCIATAWPKNNELEDVGKTPWAFLFDAVTLMPRFFGDFSVSLDRF
jgi:hypothetical protein